MAEPPSANATESLDSLREIHAGLRHDLQLTRQVNRNEPVYIAFDPVNFQAHRLGVDDYHVVACLQERLTLQQCFEMAVKRGVLDANQEAEFYRFVSQLDQLGLLTTSNQSSDDLFKRYAARQSTKRSRGLSSLLFLTVPLSNPDKFLDRTVRHFGFLFTRWAAALWLLAAIAAMLTLSARWREFAQPLNQVLATGNLLFLSIAFLGLKVWHELGHGYACKHFGGHVPEMGCRLILGMPLAYVDATSAWSFPRRTRRIIVMLGGMYFESLVAIAAIFVWASSPNSPAGAFAYQLILMAGVATVLFNANPLMRYDGYFILSELLGIPNLRTQSTQALKRTLKRWCLGLREQTAAPSQTLWILLSYGIASTAYMVSLSISIAVLLSIRLGAVGLFLAGLQLTRMLARYIKRLRSYLLKSAETEAVRGRARWCAAGITIALPVGLLLTPVPSQIKLPGAVRAEAVTVVRADAEGSIRQLHGKPNQRVAAGQPLAQLEDLDTRVRAASLRRDARRAAQQTRESLHEGPGKSWRQTLAEGVARDAAKQAARVSERLIVRAPHAGQLVEILPPQSRGGRVAVGDPIARITGGAAMVRAWISEDQLFTTQLRRGMQLPVRLLDRSAVAIVTSIAPADADKLKDLALSIDAEGQIAVNPLTGKPRVPIFEVLATVRGVSADELDLDTRVSLLAPRQFEPLGYWLARRIRGFARTLIAG